MEEQKFINIQLEEDNYLICEGCGNQKNFLKNRQLHLKRWSLT